MGGGRKSWDLRKQGLMERSYRPCLGRPMGDGCALMWGRAFQSLMSR